MNKRDFFYELPPKLIAQKPAQKRDASRLLVFERKSGTILHKHFFDIVDFLREGDLLVANNTRVLPARLFGTRNQTGARVEFLLQKRKELSIWTAIAKPSKRAKEGDIFVFSNELSGRIVGCGEGGERTIEFEYSGVFEQILERVGEIPLPHYIKQKPEDVERYQTVYSRKNGSSAAPTAGLHFTDELLKKLQEKGVEWVEVLLHVGLGTFRPVKVDNILDHKMHSEYFEISHESAQKINKAKQEGRRVIAVGTTSVRVLETAAICANNTQNQCNYVTHSTDICANSGKNPMYYVTHSTGFTDIFIYPDYNFKMVDGLITNFHLPESTLIMLVSAFCGREQTMKIYNEAVRQKYRFFSFGDASLLL